MKKKTATVKKPMKNPMKIVEDLVNDPTVQNDLKLTRTEWTIFWKTKYENEVDKFVTMRQHFEKIKAAAYAVHGEHQKMKEENTTLKKELESRVRELDAIRKPVIKKAKAKTTKRKK